MVIHTVVSLVEHMLQKLLTTPAFVVQKRVLSCTFSFLQFYLTEDLLTEYKVKTAPTIYDPWCQTCSCQSGVMEYVGHNTECVDYRKIRECTLISNKETFI